MHAARFKIPTLYIQIYSCYETEIMETKLGELSVNKIEIEEHKSDNNKISSTALFYFNG